MLNIDDAFISSFLIETVRQYDKIWGKKVLWETLVASAAQQTFLRHFWIFKKN